MSRSRFFGRILSLILLTSFLIASRTASAQITMNVPADQPSIQTGSNAANNNDDTVLVGAETYPENINFVGSLITLTSFDEPSVTIIDGGRARSVVAFNRGKNTTAVLRGFTIHNGDAQIGPPGNGQGGGAAISRAFPTINGNVIQNNVAHIDGDRISEWCFQDWR